MTSRDPDDLHDGRVDAAWRAASREEPPPALDDAIRAAARREIGAGPHRVDALRAAGPAALRPQRWWWPLAAAATIGAIVIGLLQLTDPERVAGAGEDKAVVSDTPPAPAGANKQEGGAPAPEQAAAPAPASGASAPTARPAPPALGKIVDGEARTREAPAPASVPRKDAAPIPFRRDERGATDAVAPPAVSEPRPSANAATPAPPVAQPFPGDAPKREVGASTLDGATPAAGAVAPAPSPAAPAEAPRDVQRASEGAAGFAPAPGGARRAQAADTASVDRKSAATPGILQTQAAKGRAKTAPELSVPDWIARIRRLRDDGRTDDAARELAAFRAAHPDHERLLPPDLRSWTPEPR
jgi:hypothetical protein